MNLKIFCHLRKVWDKEIYCACKDYRSTAGIVDVAKRVIINNNNRLSKSIVSGCATKYDIGDLAYEEYSDIDDEFEFIAKELLSYMR